jgi:uncharacterized cupredoxin-like copper-binding protein
MGRGHWWRRIRILLALGATVPAAPSLAQPAAVDVELSNFKYSPETIRLQPGHDYVLHLVNRSGGGHDFSAKAFFAAARIAPEDRAKLSGGRVNLGGGEEVRIHLTAPAAGRYPVRCTHFMHSTFGMTGEIVVG